MSKRNHDGTGGVLSTVIVRVAGKRIVLIFKVFFSRVLPQNPRTQPVTVVREWGTRSPNKYTFTAISSNAKFQIFLHRPCEESAQWRIYGGLRMGPFGVRKK